MKLSPARIALALLFIFIGCFGVAYAAAGMLTALPTPAVGGTCGPSTGSETALQALAQPGSIGAGPEPPASNITAHHQWTTFIQQCQAIADRRGLASLAVAVISLGVAAIGLIWVFRRRPSDSDDDTIDGSVDGATGWPVESGVAGPSELVGAGAPIAPAAYPASYPAPGQWGPAPPQGYAQPYPYPYPEQSGQPPYPYGPQPGYAPPPAYPSAPAYPTGPSYPTPPPAPFVAGPAPEPAPDGPVTPQADAPVADQPATPHDGQAHP